MLWLVSEVCQTLMSARVAKYPLGKKTAGYNSPHDWLLSLTMDIAGFVICGGENGTNGCHLTVYSEDIAFAHHFVVNHQHPILQPCRSVCGICYSSKNHLKWQAIQLAIH